MATILNDPDIHATDRQETVADLLARLGDIPPQRVRLRPFPGTATVADAVWVNDRKTGLVELVEGALIEKPMGLRESLIAGVLIELLRRFVVPRNLGLVSGESGMLQLFPGLIRMPDVAYISWNRIRGQKVPKEPAPELAPSLAVEVLSVSNTRREMQRKRQEYFDAGVQLVWMIDIDERTVTVYTSPDAFTLLRGDATLSGGEVLPGFELSLATLFAELDRQETPAV